MVFAVYLFTNTHAPYFIANQEEPEPYERYKKAIAHDIEVIIETTRLLNEIYGTENNTFIVLSDHGESFSEGGHQYHNYSLLNTEIRVPFILIDSSLANRKRLAEQGSTLDILPTLLDLFGIESSERFRGQNLISGKPLNLLLRTWGSQARRGKIENNVKMIENGHDLLKYDLNDRPLAY